MKFEIKKYKDSTIVEILSNNNRLIYIEYSFNMFIFYHDFMGSPSTVSSMKMCDFHSKTGPSHMAFDENKQKVSESYHIDGIFITKSDFYNKINEI